MSHSRLVFKILAGTYVGAELALVNSSYILGRSLDCDISIDDECLADETLKIDLLASGAIQITFLSDDKKVGVNGLRYQVSQLEIQPYDRIQVGYFVCAIGYVGSVWPNYPLVTELAEPEKEAAVEAPEESELENLTNHESERDEESNNFSMDSWGADEQENFNESDPISAEPKKVYATSVAERGNIAGLLNKIMAHRRVIAGIGSMITLMSSSFVFIAHQSHELTAFIGLTDPVTISASKNKLLESIKKDSRPKTAVITVAQIAEKNKSLVASVKDMASSFGFSNLIVEAGAEVGEVIVSGYVEDSNRWDSTSRIIQADVAQLSKLTNRVITLKQSKEQLEQIIANHGLDSSVQVFMTNKGLLAKASLLPEDEQKWVLIEQEYAALSNLQPKIHRVRDKVNGLDIKSVSFGYESYVVTADGNRYVVGSVLKDGYKIEKITPDGLVLRNEQGSVKNYPLS